MIKSIILKNIATYNEVGVKFNDLKKINFIYGLNGTGKTTISNFLQNPNKSEFSSSSLLWQKEPLQTLVYNKEFREQNFGKGKLEGVFTLGKATKEQLQNIENQKEKLNKIIHEGKVKRSELEFQKSEKIHIENDFREACWKKQREHKNNFKQTFRGASTKESFKNRVLQEFDYNNSPLKTFKELEEKAKTIFDKSSDIISPLKLNLMVIDNLNDIESNPIWSKIIVGKSDVDIASFIQKLNINDWVNEGKKHLKEDKICPFCQQETITTDFRNQLESFFDENYLKDIRKIENLKNEYLNLTKELIEELNEIEIKQKRTKDAKLNIDRFSTYLKILVNQNAANNQLINKKSKEPSRSIELISLQEQFDLLEDLINEANQEIKKHNALLSNFTTEKNNLIKYVWKFIIEDLKNDYARFNQKYKIVNNKIVDLETELKQQLVSYETINKEINELSKTITGTQSTVDEMNKILKLYGFSDLKIVSTNDKTSYQIQRENGEVAETTLSEGEITFITFLYFLQLVKGGVSEEKANQERIVVIDDPISNLDNKLVSVIILLIKEMIVSSLTDKNNVKQIILLTHNIAFSKELTSSDEIKNKKDNTCFWILKKENNSTELQNFSKK